jgi:hypothetical protein
MRRVGAIGIGLVALALVFGVGTQMASAGSCTSTTTPCTFDLSNSNVTELNGSIHVTVTWDNTSGNTVLSVQYSSGGPNTPKFIEEFGFNANVAITSISGGGAFPADWTVKHTGDPGCAGGCNIDSFGTFGTDAARPNGGFGVTSPIVFTLASLITTIPDNANGAEFVVHVGGFSGGCSGFVSDGTASGPSSTPSCGAVSEPAVLLLTGVGFAGAGYLARRRSWFNRLAS